jgi:hypothetical protein
MAAATLLACSNADCGGDADMEIAPHHSAHGLAGKRSESEPAFEVLSSDLWRIVDRVRTSWKGGGLLGTTRSKEPLAEADR